MRTWIETRWKRAAAGLFALASAAQAQSYNIDIGANTTFPNPPMVYPGAAAQPGWWEPVDGAAVNHFLHDLTGITTLVRLSVAGGAGNFEFNNAGTAGADQSLYDDLQNVGAAAAGAVATWTFTNLANGLYDIYTYAWAPDNAAARTLVEVDCSLDADVLVGGAWPGAHLFGTTFAVHRVNVSAGTLSVRVTASALFGSVNGFQLRKLAPTGIAGCFGDGTDNACPCFFGAAGHGCENSSGTGGALLAAYGNPSVAADTVQLAATSLPPNVPHLYFQGSLAIQPCGAGCFGTPFGDGLRCVGGDVIRLSVKTASPCGSSNYPGPGEDAVSVKGALPAAGGTRFYQVWYRDAAPAYCTIFLFNLSNGYQIDWGA